MENVTGSRRVGGAVCEQFTKKSLEASPQSKRKSNNAHGTYISWNVVFLSSRIVLFGKRRIMMEEQEGRREDGRQCSLVLCTGTVLAFSSQLPCELLFLTQLSHRETESY